MSKRIRKPKKRERFSGTNYKKYYRKVLIKHINYKQIGAKLELDDTQSRNQIIKDLKILAAQDKIISTR
jgi:ribonuclease R